MDRRRVLQGMLGAVVLAQPACAAIEKVTRPKPNLEGRVNSTRRWTGERVGLDNHDEFMKIAAINFSPTGDSGVILTKSTNPELYKPIIFVNREELDLFNFQQDCDDHALAWGNGKRVKSFIWDKQGNALINYYGHATAQYPAVIQRENIMNALSDNRSLHDDIICRLGFLKFNRKIRGVSKIPAANIKDFSMDKDGNVYVSFFKGGEFGMFTANPQGPNNRYDLQLVARYMGMNPYVEGHIAPRSISPFGDYVVGDKRRMGDGKHIQIYSIERDGKELVIDQQEELTPSFDDYLRGWVVHGDEQYAVFGISKEYKIWRAGSDPDEVISIQADHVAIPDNNSALYAVMGDHLYEVDPETGNMQQLRGILNLVEGRQFEAFGISSQGSIAVLSRDTANGQFNFLVE
jgi:hypothetical protein